MRTLITSALALGLCASPAALADEMCYDLEEVNVPDDDGDDLYSSWYGINNRGEVAGNFCLDPTCAANEDGQMVGGAIYDSSSGTFETFTLSSPYNWVGGVNISARGVVVGEALEMDWSQSDPIVSGVGFVRETDGTITYLEPPEEDVTVFYAESINASGIIIGQMYDPDDGRRTSWVYDDGDYTVYEATSGDTGLLDITSQGDLVGWATDEDGRHGFVDEHAVSGSGKVSEDPELIDVPGAASTWVYGINEKGVLVGTYLDEVSDRYGYVYDGDDFSTVEFPGAASTRVADINNRGTIVGTFDYYSWGLIGEPTSCD